MKMSWQVILVLVYSMANVLFSLVPGRSHAQSPRSAQSTYLTVGILGVLVGGALALQHNNIVKLEKLLSELNKRG
jgi:hypothetical protein